MRSAHAIERAGDNAAFTRDIGHPISRGILEFGDGNYASAAKLIRPVRAIAHRFGGSHAQRDVIDLTLVEAAMRSGDAHLASALTAERAAARPDSPLSQLFVRRAGKPRSLRYVGYSLISGSTSFARFRKDSCQPR